MTEKKTSPTECDELISAARKVSRNAYAPHSHLRVGAALRGRSGRIHTGCNVENASLGLTICAERAALFHAVAEGEREFEGLAIHTPDAEALSPCGACRQVLAEFAPELPIISEGGNGERVKYTLSDLLPQAFRSPNRRPGAGRAAQNLSPCRSTSSQEN